MSNLVKKLFALVFIGFSLHLVIIYYTPSLMMKFIGRNWEEQNMICLLYTSPSPRDH